MALLATGSLFLPASALAFRLPELRDQDADLTCQPPALAELAE
jgi:hypothetical protein